LFESHFDFNPTGSIDIRAKRGQAVQLPSDNDYDILPYQSIPFAQTQPSHLAAIATLFGVVPPSADRAQVLELGCAAGGNIIPLAARFPRARFTGFDLSTRHVEDAQQAIRQLGLANIEISKGDLAGIDLADRQFEYIICHGVFSWVPRNAQDAIFRICSQNLVPNGVAYISYNVLPGWHLRKVVRDICAYHAGTDGTPQHRVARARWMLDKVAKLSSDTTNFGRILRDEAKLTAPLPDSYILGEFLADDNTPSYFHEFVERATGHDLTFLCETNLALSIPENHGVEQAELIRTIAGNSGVFIEQYIDFFTGRPFRRSLLIKSGQASKIERKISPQRLGPLQFASRLRLDSATSKMGTSIFTHEQRSMTTNDPIVHRAMELLAAAYPANCSLEELIGDDSMKGKPIPPSERTANEARLLDALFKAVTALHVAISTLPLKVGRAGTARPVVFRVARLQAANGQSWASSLEHAAVALHPAMRLLLPFMDGTRDRSALHDRLADALRNREINVEHLYNEAALSNPDILERIATTMLDRMLHYLEQNALLDPT
jgi:methyltransferase-like protein/predicted O-methyltransferase YrrM